MIRRALLLLPLLLAGTLHAQIIEVQGGASTLYNANGAGAVFHFNDSTATAGAGFVNGHFQYGFSDSFNRWGWDFTAGDHLFSFQAGGAGLGIAARGLSVTRKRKNSSLTIFAGATGASFGTPFFQAATGQHFGAGISYQRAFGAFEISSIAVLAGNQRTAVQSVRYHWKAFHVTGAGGVLQNSRYLNGQLDFQQRWAGFEIARTAYQFATVNSAGGFFLAGPIQFRASAFSSNGATGETAGATARISFIELRADVFKSRAGLNTTATISERIGRRWRFDESISESQGRYNVSPGFSFVSNRLTASVGYQTFWMPLLGQFQQAISAQISFHLPHDSAATIATALNPNGHLTYAAYGSTWIQGKLSGPNSERTQSSAMNSKFVVRGIVLDANGAPVAGAAVSVGGQISYSDSAGEWLVRCNRARPALVSLAVGEFSAPGEWRAADSPQTITPAPESTASRIILHAVRM
jgi:hypothetical protein